MPIVLVYIASVKTETLIDIDGHRTIASMHHGARKIDKHNFVVLHDKMMQFEWHVLRDADCVYLPHVSYRLATVRYGELPIAEQKKEKKNVHETFRITW